MKSFLGLLCCFTFLSLFSCQEVEGKKESSQQQISTALSSATLDSREDDGQDKDRAPALTVLQRWTMPKDLEEISGMCFYKNYIACIQDEDGSIFLFNPSSGKVDKEIKFEGKGDYEDIVILGETAWVLRSDGTLFEVSNFNSGDPKTQKHKTLLNGKNNTEGLFADLANHRLLISVKDKDPFSKHSKGVYAYDLNNGSMQAEPVFKIGTGKEKGKHDKIHPADIALVPGSNELYVIDGHDKILYRVAGDGQILQHFELDRDRFPQPEGLCFGSDGALYISSEGAGDEGSIAKVAIGK